MADNNNGVYLHRRMEAQEQTSKAQQEALDNIQQILAQLLTKQNNDNTTGSNHKNKENNTNEPLKTDHSKEGSSIDAEVIKDIQAQLKGMNWRKYGQSIFTPWNGIQSQICQSSSHQRCTRMMARAHQISTFTTSDRKPVM